MNSTAFISKKYLMKLHSAKRKCIAFTIIALTIVFFGGCGGVTKQIVDTGEKEASVNIIVNDARINAVDHGPDLVNKLEEVFGKSFNKVAIRTGYDNPKHGEYVIRPLELRVYCVQEPWHYFKGSSGKTLKIPDCKKPTIFKAESKFEVTNNKESNSYSFISEGSYEPSLGGSLLQLPLGILSFSGQMALWKNTARGRALECVAIDLHNKVVPSPEFRRYAESSKMAETAAANLDVSLKFTDTDSLIPNNTIDAGEKCKFILTVTNELPCPPVTTKNETPCIRSKNVIAILY